LTGFERAISEHVVVQCPACNACESVEASALADRRAIVCRECGETWPAGGIGPKGAGRVLRRRDSPPVLVAERQPLITYSDTADRAWQAKIEGDYWPEPPRQRRFPMIAAGVAAAFFLAAFFGAREAAVAALPDLAGLYAAVGLPVNLDRLAIEDIVAERMRAFEGQRVTVRAVVRNLGAAPRPIPTLVAELGHGGAPLGTFGFDPPEEMIAPGQSIAVVVELGAVPESADQVELRFQRRGETLAAAGTAKLAQR
jgi:hypothetical protein